MKKYNNQTKQIFGILFEAVSEGVIVVNQKQEIVTCNNSANLMFGYSDDDLIEKPLKILIPQEYHPNHSGHFNNFIHHSDKRQMGRGRDLYGARKDGCKFPVEVGLNPFEIEGEKYVMAIIIDITIRKNQEAEILELNEQLEQKISDRTEELHNSIQELQAEVKKRKEAENRIKEALRVEIELNDLKTKFLSMVSHEFKTPLSSILNSATLTGKYTESEQQLKREKHLKTIKNKVKYLNSILNDFLSIERLDTGNSAYKFSVFPFSKVINEVVYDANMLLKDGQKINYPQNIDDIDIEFDEKILELILTNLINNAIKYSPEDTVIDILVNLQDDKLIVSITDQGMGIPTEEQKFIFNRYFRAENALLNHGTGIGLNIVKSHLESLGGSITFVSEVYKGSTFSIQIPIKNT